MSACDLVADRPWSHDLQGIPLVLGESYYEAPVLGDRYWVQMQPAAYHIIQMKTKYDRTGFVVDSTCEVTMLHSCGCLLCACTMSHEVPPLCASTLCWAACCCMASFINYSCMEKTSIMSAVPKGLGTTY